MHRPHDDTRLKNGVRGERPAAITPDRADLLEGYVEHNRFEQVDEYGREPLFTSTVDRKNGISIRCTVYTVISPCYRKLYDLLAEKTDEYGAVHVFEDLPHFTLPEYLSIVYGIIPYLRYGSTFDIGRYGWVGDSNWLTLLHYQWLAITPL